MRGSGGLLLRRHGGRIKSYVYVAATPARGYETMRTLYCCRRPSRGTVVQYFRPGLTEFGPRSCFLSGSAQRRIGALRGQIRQFCVCVILISLVIMLGRANAARSKQRQRSSPSPSPSWSRAVLDRFSRKMRHHDHRCFVTRKVQPRTDPGRPGPPTTHNKPAIDIHR